MEKLVKSAGATEVNRSELAQRFQCAPSQITYVLMTRFTLERGYVVESRRGLGGYIRITPLGRPAVRDVIEQLTAMGGTATQAEAVHFIERLKAGGLLTEREAALIARAVDRDVLALGLPERDLLRFRLLSAMLGALLSERRRNEGFQDAL